MTTTTGLGTYEFTPNPNYRDRGHTDIVPADALTAWMADYEDRHLRSNSDSASGYSALRVWNDLREFAGYPVLTADDLRMRQVRSSPGVTLESLRRFDAERGKNYHV